MDAAEDKLVVVDFFTDWCGPCKLIYPQLVALSAELEPAATIVKFNCNQYNKELAKTLGIKVAPTFHLYKNGQKVADMTGACVLLFVFVCVTEEALRGVACAAGLVVSLLKLGSGGVCLLKTLWGLGLQNCLLPIAQHSCQLPPHTWEASLTAVDKCTMCCRTPYYHSAAAAVVR